MRAFLCSLTRRNARTQSFGLILPYSVLLKGIISRPGVLPSVSGFHREPEFCPDSPEAPDPTSGSVVQVTVALDSVFIQVRDQKITETPLLKRRKSIFLTPDLIYPIQFKQRK